MRDFTKPGRSAVHAVDCAVATSHPLASVAAMDVLGAGGNAVDAAIAAAAVLCVVEPAMTGIGGDAFALYMPAGAAEPLAINGSGRAPAAADPAWYRERGLDAIAQGSAHAVTVPGAVAAWCRLVEDHGTRSLAELLAPAIRYAEEGYPVAPRVAWDWGREAPRLAGDPWASRHLLVDGAAPRVGTRHSQPALGATLRRIAAQGRAGFYEGEVAADLVARLRELGGLHTEEDFAREAPDYVTPIRTGYRGFDVWECPPNGQGVAALLILNLLSGFDPGTLDEADRVHLHAEATKQAYHNRDLLVCDPECLPLPVETILSDRFADGLRRRISMDRAGVPAPWDATEHRDTICLSVVDRDGNAISWIQSLFHAFGSGIAGPRSGVMLQSRGTSFRLLDDHPNLIGPRKRPMHTIIPGMLTRGGRAVMPFGVMGGHYQAAGHAALVSALLDRGLDLQEAVDAPRSFAFGGELQLEAGIDAAIAAEMERRGHRIHRLDGPTGGAQAIWIDRDAGLLTAASDPRKDGCALGR
ncbi:gamma-glutamyltransferase family protein [Arenibaculum pallidiluteum]|uniref:gamma-glutamyltransferase family protein n=1 Tax=Arenibaculum pallidiluteum TaxID=2812559 RepID=UPI001A972D02|nr:gamma-glutamyltransferase family protein [Arenibaculum pallidiluteum]